MLLRNSLKFRGILVNKGVIQRINLSSSSSSGKDKIIQSSIIAQQGNEISELPIVLRKISGEFLEDKRYPLESNHLINIGTEDIILLIEECKTINTVLFVINAFKEHNQMPVEVAIHAFHKLLEVGGSVDLRNLEDTSDLFNNLVTENIVKNGATTHILEILSKIRKDSVDLKKTILSLNNELLLRNTDGLLNIVEVCECMKVMDQSALADKFWTGIVENSNDITADNVVFVFRILPTVKEPRKLISAVLDRRIPEIWYNLKPEVVVECMHYMKECGLSLHSVFHSFARWLNTNGHSITESQLSQIIKQFRLLNFVNTEIEKSLERFMKGRAVNIKNQVLIDEILSYSINFRIRNTYILNGCCENFIFRSDQYHPKILATLLNALAQFNFAPTNRVKFWMKVEEFIEKNFSKIAPVDIIQMFLNCCFLEIYPLNFISSIFNPHFLDALYASVEDDKISKLKIDLKLLDTALTLEASNYNGPLLPKDHSAKSLWTDGRIRRAVNSLQPYMEKLAGGHDRTTNSVIVGKLPTNNLYIADILIHPPGLTRFFQYSIFEDKNVFIAIFILLPEWFDNKGGYLCGIQEMRIRHFRKLGFKVVTLKYSEVQKLLIHSKQLEGYLEHRMKNALPALNFK